MPGRCKGGADRAAFVHWGIEAGSLISVETGNREILSWLPPPPEGVLRALEHPAVAFSPKNHPIPTQSICWLPVSGCAAR